MKYRSSNWKQYNKALTQRGSLNFWISEDALRGWVPAHNNRPCRPREYSDSVILLALTLKAVFRLAYRQTEGFLSSILQMMGVNLPVPSYTQICRRAKNIRIPKQLSKSRNLHILIDSSGLKIYGDGEWNAKKHGPSKRRTWRKFHIAVDRDTLEILTTKVTDSKTADCQVLPQLLETIEGKIERVYGDGAYDTQGCYEVVSKAGARIIVPPRKGAQHQKTSFDPFHLRNDYISQIKAFGDDDIARAIWKKLHGYHNRSLVETTMFRIKHIFGERLSSHLTATQNVEVLVRVAALNRMTRLGMPEGYMLA